MTGWDGPQIQGPVASARRAASNDSHTDSWSSTGSRLPKPRGSEESRRSERSWQPGVFASVILDDCTVSQRVPDSLIGDRRSKTLISRAVSRLCGEPDHQ